MPLILSGNVASATGSTYEVANSCRFNDGDNAKMSHARSGSPTNPDKYTLSFWIKRSTLGNQVIFGNYNSSSFRAELSFSSGDKLQYIKKMIIVLLQI